MPSSSSGSEDDEERRKLAQAVDPDFLGAVTVGGAQSKSLKNGRDPVIGYKRDNHGAKCAEGNLPPSKRAKIFNDNPARNEFTKLYSLDVTPDSKQFIAKQLAKSLEKNLKEVSPPPEPASTKINDPAIGIKLFATSTTTVTEGDLEYTEPGRRPRPKQKSKAKKKRKSENGGSTDSSDSETEKLKSVAVSADWVLNQ